VELPAGFARAAGLDPASQVALRLRAQQVSGKHPRRRELADADRAVKDVRVMHVAARQRRLEYRHRALLIDDAFHGTHGTLNMPGGQGPRMPNSNDARQGSRAQPLSPAMQFLSLAVVALVSATAGVLLYLWMAQQWAKPPVEVIDVAPAPRPQRATAVAETVSPEAVSVESEPAFSPSRTPERSPMLGPDETLEAPIPFGQLAPIEKPVIP